MVDLQKIVDGKMNGKILWICDLRYRDYGNKPLRHVRPTKVMVTCNENTTKKIYYSKSHFVPIDKNGKALKSKVIPVFDNTGYRCNTGTPVKIFSCKMDCIRAYNSIVDDAINGLSRHLRYITNEIKNRIFDLKKEKLDTETES